MTIRFKLIMAAIAIIVVANSILTFVAIDYIEPSKTWRLLLLMLGTTAASLFLIYAVTMLVMRPIGRIVAMSRKVISGDMTARVAIRPPGELGLLCQAIDAMAEAVARREAKLTQSARQQVGRAEKLASIGRLAAGVAHEINNPLTGVLTFAHLLRQKPHMTDEDQQDLDLIINETTRAAEIVRGLLDFARERPTMMEPLDLNDVVRRTVRLIANQKKFEHIVIEEALQNDLPEVRGDVNPLQQVILESRPERLRGHARRRQADDCDRLRRRPRAAARRRFRLRHQGRSSGEDLRAVFHDAARGQGYGPGAERHLRHRRAA